MQLHNFDTATFLRDYWQQKPLVIRNPWGEWHNPLSPDELAGLACEDSVESRLISYGNEALETEDGPFPEERFAGLGNGRMVAAGAGSRSICARSRRADRPVPLRAQLADRRCHGLGMPATAAESGRISTSMMCS